MSFGNPSSSAQWQSIVSQASAGARPSKASETAAPAPATATGQETESGWNRPSSAGLPRPRVLTPLDTSRQRSTPDSNPSHLQNPSRSAASPWTRPVHSIANPGVPSPNLTHAHGAAAPRAEAHSPTTSTYSLASPTSSTFDRFSTAQLSILLDSFNDSKVDRVKNLLDTSGQEVLTLFFRKTITLNASSIFADRKASARHGTYNLLSSRIRAAAEDPIQVFALVDAVDFAKEEAFRDFDVANFVAHFVQHPFLQFVLATAFTSCSRPDLRLKAHTFALSLESECYAAILARDSQLHQLPATTVAFLLSNLSPPANTSVKQDILEILINTSNSTGIDSAPSEEIMSAASSWKLPEQDRLLIDALKKSGPRSGSTRSSIDEALSLARSDPFTPPEVANVLLFALFSVPAQFYNVSELVAALRHAPQSRELDWNDVVNSFDLADLGMRPDLFLRLFKALHPIALADQNFNLHGLWSGTWQNASTQVSFLRSYFECQDITPSSIPNFETAFALADFQGLSENAKAIVTTALNSRYANLQAMKAVFDVVLVDNGIPEGPDGNAILRDIVNSHLLVFMLSVNRICLPFGTWSQTQERFVESCFAMYLEKRQPDSSMALEALYEQNPRLIQNLCTMIFHSDPRRTDTIYHRAEESGWTDFLLGFFQTPLALDIACLKQKEQPGFDLESWIANATDNLSTAEKINAGSILWKFLRIKADDEYRAQREATQYQSVPLSLRAVYVFLWKLRDLMADREQIKAAQCTCLTTYPRLMNFGQNFDDILEQTSAEKGNKLAPEIDERMSELFGQMYRNEVSIRDMVTEMRNYKTSDDHRLQDLFCCIVHGLFDEYGCYGEYPEEALEKTALLFGSIIKFKLLPPLPQEYGLALIVDAVKDHMPETPMYRFGIEALLQVGEHLHEWPDICEMLLQIPHLSHPEILQKAQDSLAEYRSNGGLMNGLQSERTMTNGIGEDAGSGAGSRSFRGLRFDVPDPSLGFSDPDSKSQETILFVINNLSQENMKAKLADLQKVLLPEHHQWFAAYLVEQRVRLEPNNQQMYCELLNLLDDHNLMSEVLRETYVSVVKTMSARSTIESSVERGHLKNLGAWLGTLTLAQDKPIKHDNIFFLDLLLDGFESQRLAVVIPFTCKVLTAGAASTVFREPNPWLMEIVGVLLELYYHFDLKVNLKFEIEVLCREHQLDHKKTEHSFLIRDHQQQIEEELTNASAIDNLDEYPKLSLRVNRLREAVSAQEIMDTLPSLDEVLRYPPVSGSPQEQASVRGVINRAVERAIQEIIAPVVERSITIASLSTSQLVSKDYAVESSAERYGHAAREMVKALAGSLALVTCKEPLRMSITNYIRQYLEELGAIHMAEGMILMSVNDNLDIASSLIKEAAEQRAVPEMEGVIEAELEDRRRFQAENPGADYAAQTLNRWASWIPEPYKMTRAGLNEAQVAVYEDFARRVHGMNTGHTQNPSTDSTGRQLPDVLNEPLTIPNLSTPADQPALPHQSPLSQQDNRTALPQPRMNGLPDSMPPYERISLLIDVVQKAARSSVATRLKDLEQDSTTFQDLRQILIILSASSRPALDHLARQIADKITTILVRQPPQNLLEAEFLAFLLNKLCNVSEAMVREIMRWISANEEPLLQSSFVSVAFMGTGLMEFSRVDSVIAGAMRDHSELGLRLLRDLMEYTLFNDEPAALRADYIQSITALYTWLKEDPENPIVRELVAKLKDHGVPEYVTVALDNKELAKQDQMKYVFREWYSLYDKTAYHESTYAVFLRNIHERQILNNSEDLVTFLRLAVETSIEGFELEAQSFRASLNTAFTRIDSLSLLIMLLVKFQGESNGAVKLSKAAYLDTILTLLVLVTNQHQELRGTGIQQRVFTRLFNTMLYNYAELRFDELPEHVGFMSAFGRTIKALQPMVFPGLAYGWTTLVCHRVFVDGTLKAPAHEDNVLQYRELLGLMMQYVAQLHETPRLQSFAEPLSRGVWRNVFVLQHDYPDFICENHSYLLSRVSLREPQLRNLVLSARPLWVEEPDPLTPGLKVERLEGVKQVPRLAANIDEHLEQAGLKSAVTNALANGSELEQSVKHIASLLQDEASSQATFVEPALDISILQSLVIVVVQDAVEQNIKFDSDVPHLQFLSKLLTTLAPRPKYLLITALVDQLRYPNAHTEFCCRVVMHLWKPANNTDEQAYVKEIIVRVLRERLDGQPHPWGAIVLFKELTENPAYGFWDSPPFLSEPDLRQRLIVAIRGHQAQDAGLLA